MSIPTLLLNTATLSDSNEGDETSDDGSSRDSSDMLGPSDYEPPRTRQRTGLQDSVDNVYNVWHPNDEDDSSLRQVRRLGIGKAFIEVEISCSLFAILSGAVKDQDFDHRGEPNNWGAGYDYLKSDTREMDQPWLEARLNHDTETWGVHNHEGRHRSAWVCNHLHYRYLTIVIGLEWDRFKDMMRMGASKGEIFTGSGAKAELRLNTRRGGVEFMLVKV